MLSRFVNRVASKQAPATRIPGTLLVQSPSSPIAGCSSSFVKRTVVSSYILLAKQIRENSTSQEEGKGYYQILCRPNETFLVSGTRPRNRAFSSHGNAWMNPDNQGAGEALSQYSVDLTQMAKDGKLDPVIGRHEEIRRTLQILARRAKNNPVLIGEPGRYILKHKSPKERKGMYE